MNQQVTDTPITIPPASLDSVAITLKEHLLRDWAVDRIKTGIKRVRQTDIGVVRDVYVAPGLYATLCHQKHGTRSRKPFFVGNFKVHMWRQGALNDKHSTLAKS